MASVQMSDLDRYGIRGLQAILDGAYGPDQAALAHGMDLNMLGLDLNRCAHNDVLRVAVI